MRELCCIDALSYASEDLGVQANGAGKPIAEKSEHQNLSHARVLFKCTPAISVSGNHQSVRPL
jgi:hypothetical protein